MRVPSMLIAAVLAASSLGVASAASALVPADVTLTAGPVSTVVSVSPDVFYDAPSATYYLYTTGPGTGAPPSPGGPSIGVYSSKDGTSWAEVPGASTPVGPYFDPSVVAMSDGTYRMYLVSKSGTAPGCSGKQLKYATSTDLVRWTAQSPVLLDDLGCGVPNVVRASDSDYRLYYVRGGEGVEHGTYMATSPDGLTWTARDGILTPEDFVDPSVVKLDDGSWLMFTADFPASKSSGPFFQKLYAGTSSDGFTWDFDAVTPLYNGPTGQGAFDPDAVVLPDGSIRAWWAQGTSPDTAVVASGAVTVAVSPDPEPVIPVAPTKPKATWTSKALKVAWTYAVGAAAPESFAVQVRTTGSWATVATVAGDRAATSVSRAKLPKSAFSVRVVAIIGDEEAASPSTKVAKAR
jgi:hypothetical protein